MLRFIRQGRRRKELKKLKPGDGHLLKPYRLWHIFTHSLFHVEITKKRDMETRHYALKSRYFTEEPSVDLYQEGRHVAFSKLPATFPVENGVIEVKNSTISHIIGIVAVIILLISLVITVLQLAELAAEIPWVQENIGTFTSPISLSFWENFTVAIIAATAALERALMLKRHWLVDIETGSGMMGDQ